MNFTKSLEKNIDKLVGTLKNEEELKEVLKRKLTKKEYKIYCAFEEGKTLIQIIKDFKEEEERIKSLYKQACWKINQEKIKKELIIC